jgi:hypothetical protein
LTNHRGEARLFVKSPDISWERFERNQRQLKANSIQGIGIPREGPSLLSGLIVCGHCGLRMNTYYSNNGHKLRYSCNKMMASYGDHACQSLVGDTLDRLIVDKMFEALQPSSLDISLRVAEDIENERKNLTLHWNKELERARYEVERAYRQYNAAEPENRLVARTLEKKWEEVLTAEEKLKREYAQFVAEQPAVLSTSEREAIRQLATDIPSLWSSTTTTIQEKQEIIRLLIERIIVTVDGITEKVAIEIHWFGGHKTHSLLIRPIAKTQQLSYYNDLLKRIRELQVQKKNLKQIAIILNEEGWKRTKDKSTFDGQAISALLARSGERSRKKLRVLRVKREANEFTLLELSQKVDILEPTLHSWVKKGILKARKATDTSHNGIWLATADETEIKRLHDLKNRPREWIYRSKVERVE